VPVGGTTGQVLTKNSATDYDTLWSTPSSGPWTDTGSTLTPVTPTRTVSVPGGAAGAGVATVLLGSNTAKARLQTNNAAATPWLALSTNRDSMTAAQDDATKPSWQMTLRSDIDQASIVRAPAGSSAVANLLVLNNTGQLIVPGPTATGTDQAPIVIGNRVGKGRLMTVSTLDWVGLTKNAYYTGSAWAQDDTTTPSWVCQLSSADTFGVSRAPATTGVPILASLLTLDSLGALTLPGDSATKASVVFGTQTTKARLQSSNTSVGPWFAFTTNRDAQTGVQDDTSKPSWQMVIRSDATDSFNVGRQPPAGSFASLFNVSNAGYVTFGMAKNNAGVSFPANYLTGTLNTWVGVVTVSLTTHGGPVLVVANPGAALTVPTAQAQIYIGLFRDGGTMTDGQYLLVAPGSGTRVPCPTMSWLDPAPPAGAHSYQFAIYQVSNGPVFITAPDNQGYLQAVELG
jgi:hypothetical protein